jgi:hypothetical protein
VTADLAACLGKSPFLTFRQAARKAQAMNRRKDTGDHLAAYRCRDCGRYHVGNQNGATRQQRRDHKRRKALLDQETE